MGVVLGTWACTGPPDDTSVDDTEIETDVDTDTVDTDTLVDTDSDAPALEFQSSGAVVCRNPQARADSLWDVVEARPMTAPSEVEFRLQGGGMVAADLTGDAKLDLFVPGVVDIQLHIQQDLVSFDEQAAERMPGIDLSDATGATAVDYDGDGDLDLFVTRWFQPNRLLNNDGTGHFTDVTEGTGLGDRSYRSQTSSWGDMDGDGDLDLFVGNYGPKPEDGQSEDIDDYEPADPNRLFENLGDGTFVDHPEVIPQEVHDAYAFMSSWIDLDLDGDLDLLVINDFGWVRPSRIFWHTDEGLVMDDGGAGFDLPFAGMGLGIADLNGDGYPDFLQSSWRETSLLISAGGRNGNRPYWVEESQSRGLTPDFDGGARQIFGWGAELSDLDNDGDEDAIINYGYWDEYRLVPEQADGVFEQAPDGTFTDRASAWGLADQAATRGLALVDLNDDGLLDVVKRRLNARTPMYLSRCSGESWMRIRPRMPAPNTFAVGTRFRFVAGDKTWSRTVVSGGTSMYTGGPPEVHVGLGDLEQLDLVEVFWPDGKISRLRDVPVNQLLDLVRP